MAKQQPTLFSFFNKTPKAKENVGLKHSQHINASPSGEGHQKRAVIKLKGVGTEIKPLDLIWSKLEGYPWWPALIYEHPTEKVIYKNRQVHVQFFDDPPTRGWVKEAFVKLYGPPAECGIPTYRDPEWAKAKQEADQVVDLAIKDREALIVQMQPSDGESESDPSDLEDSEVSKENIDMSIASGGKRHMNGSAKNEPQAKKRRIILLSESEGSEDEYQPDPVHEDYEDDSASSGVEEDKVPDIEPETESECGSPIKEAKKPKARGGTSSKAKKKNILFTPKGSLNSSVSVPQSLSVSESTKSKLSSFAHKESPTVATGAPREDWPHLNLQWLKPENIKDINKCPKGHPDYDPRTLYFPDDFLSKQTPAMRQWWEIKAHHFDTVLFFKMGKFYELFHMDAILSIQELGLLMMKGDYAHTGFPEIAYGRYSSTLIDKGFKVGRIEQTETPEMMENRCKNIPRPTKFDKVVKRELCQVTSLGTRVPSVMDGESSDGACNYYLLSITERLIDGPGETRQIGVSFIDTSIGTFYLSQFVDDRHVSRLRTLLAHYPPAQILSERGKITPKTLKLLKAVVPFGLLDVLIPEKEFWTASKTLKYLAESGFFRDGSELVWPQGIRDVLEEGDSLGLTAKDEYELGISSLGGLIWYLQICKLEEDLLTRKMFEVYFPTDAPENAASAVAIRKHLILDGTTLRNLDVFENSSDGSSEGTLFETLNHCSTPFGKRLLHKWICSPLSNEGLIDSRLDAVEDLREHPEIVSAIKPMMKSLPDLEKLLSKIHTIGLKHSPDHPDNRAIYYEGKQYSQRKVSDFLCAVRGFRVVEDIINAFKDISGEFKSKLLKSCVTYQEDGGKLFPLDKILKFFDNAFDHSLAKKEGKIIPSEGVDPEYDGAVSRITETKEASDYYLKEQCKHFGAKVTYWGNDKKRFQLEVPDHAAKKAGDEHELVSQKKGFKRYWTQETKEFLSSLMTAEEERENALQDIARRIFHQFDEHHREWSTSVECIAVIDVLLSLTQYSLQVDSTRPVVQNISQDQKPFICIRDGRYPCSLKLFGGGDYIPNDIIIGCEEEDSHSQLVLVTGPNMGGKSTLMRQTALICLMAQMGSYVPATECRLSAADRIFTRLGAWDRIYQGESTFYVELAETASIMQHATRHSLVIVDELGRGTATYDGAAIAYSVVDALTRVNCRTLFSTHYHSLVHEFRDADEVSLGHMACMVESENDDDPTQETITFLYKFAKGACPKSYGFNAARLASLPESVIKCASAKARELEVANRRKKTFRQMFSNPQTSAEGLKNIVLGYNKILVK